MHVETTASDTRLFGSIVEYWIFNPAARVRFPRNSWDSFSALFVMLCFLLWLSCCKIGVRPGTNSTPKWLNYMPKWLSSFILCYGFHVVRSTPLEFSRWKPLFSAESITYIHGESNIRRRVSARSKNKHTRLYL